MSYHINPKTGDVNPCGAQPGNCKFKSEHYETREAAQAAYEEKMSSENLKSFDASQTSYTVEGFNYVKRKKGWFRACRKCNGTGHLSQYNGIQGGVCFRCMGDGADNLDVSFKNLSEVSKDAERRRRAADKYREKAEERRRLKVEKTLAEAAAKAEDWRREHPEASQILENFKNSESDSSDARWLKQIHDSLSYARSPIDEYEDLSERILEANEREAKRIKEIKSLKRLEGNIGDTVSVKAKIVKKKRFQSQFGESTVVELHTENQENLVFFSSAKWLDRLSENSEISFSATIKAQSTDLKGAPQTVLKRPKLLKD
jgi:hypothetical protein